MDDLVEYEVVESETGKVRENALSFVAAQKLVTFVEMNGTPVHLRPMSDLARRIAS